MGMNMSSMGMGLKGASMSQALGLVMDKLYDQIVKKDTEDFPAFLHAILEIFSAINMALPGKHYDRPSLEDVTELFYEWKNEADSDKRRNILIEFMKKNVNMNKVDEAMIITAIVAPPAAMVAKRTGQILPQLELMKSVPDVVFVASAIVLALIGVKIVRYMFMEKIVNMNKVDKAMIITTTVAPLAAMVAKRTEQILPQLELMKSVPDVVFVPTATVVALVAVKILRYMFMGKTISKDDAIPHVFDPRHAPPYEPEPEPAPELVLAPPAGDEQPKHAPPNFHWKLSDCFHSDRYTLTEVGAPKFGKSFRSPDKTKSKDEKGPQHDEVQHSDFHNIPETSRAHHQQHAPSHDKQVPIMSNYIESIADLASNKVKKKEDKHQ